MLSERMGLAKSDVLPREKQLLSPDIPKNGQELDKQLFTDLKTSMLNALSRHRPVLNPENGQGATTQVRFGDSYNVNVVSLGDRSRITVRTEGSSFELNNLEQQTGLHFLSLRVPLEGEDADVPRQASMLIQTSQLPQGSCIIDYKEVLAGQLTDRADGEMVMVPVPDGPQSLHIRGMKDRFTEEEREAVTAIKRHIAGFIGPFIQTVNETPAAADIHLHTSD